MNTTPNNQPPPIRERSRTPMRPIRSRRRVMPKSQIEPGCKPQVRADASPPSLQRVNSSEPGCKKRQGLPIPKRLRDAESQTRKKKCSNPTSRRIERALKAERKLWSKMADAYRANWRGRLRHLINIYITSYDVRLAHVYRANLKRKKHLRLPLRNLEAIAHEVNLLKRCDEPVKIIKRAKKDGTFREIANPGIRNKARSMIFASVLGIARDLIPDNAFYTGNGGRSAAIQAVQDIAAQPDCNWIVENDIADFYGSFDENAVIELLRKILPIDPKAIRYTALSSSMNFVENNNLRRNTLHPGAKPLRTGGTNHLRKRINKIRKREKKIAEANLQDNRNIAGNSRTRKQNTTVRHKSTSH